MELRQSENHFSIMGYVKEVGNLALKSKVKDGAKINFITGRFIVKVSDEREVTVNVSYVPEFTKTGNPSKKYLALKELIDKKHPTIGTLEEVKANALKKAQAMYSTDVDALNKATAEIEAMKPCVVSLWGDSGFAPRIIDATYYSPQTESIKEGTKVDLGFANITIKDPSTDPANFHAKGTLEVYVANVLPEMKGDQETGNAIIKGIASGYEGVFPIDIVALKTDEFDFASMCLNQLDPGRTVSFFVELAFDKIIKRIERGGFGKAQVEEKVTTIFQYQTLGGDFTSEDKAFTQEQIQVAMTHRKGAYFDQLKQQAENRQSAPAPQATQGFGGAGFGGFGAPASSQVPQMPAQPTMARPNPSSLF